MKHKQFITLLAREHSLSIINLIFFFSDEVSKLLCNAQVMFCDYMLVMLEAPDHQVHIM